MFLLFYYVLEKQAIYTGVNLQISVFKNGNYFAVN